MRELARHAGSLFNVKLSVSQIAALEKYERELLDWNKHTNLTAIDTAEQVRIKHFLDSLSCLEVLRESKFERVIDVGTGAGFPGLVLKIICPSIHLTLVESVGKKAAFCQHMVQVLDLDYVEVRNDRVEALGQETACRERYDWAIGRAVAVMPVLMEYLLPLVRMGGKALAMKGENAPAEAHKSERAIKMLGGHLNKLVPVLLPGVAEQRYLVVVDKVAVTPPNYPRRIGMPSKKPL